MKFHTTVVLLIAAAVAAFAALNWEIFIAPTELSLGVTAVRASLGLVMLGLAAVLTILFLAFAVGLQAATLKENRLQAARARADRVLAEKAETSRYIELRGLLKSGLKKEENLTAESTAAVLAQLRRAVADLQTLIEQSGNTLAAYIGEVEDRLENAGDGCGSSGDR